MKFKYWNGFCLCGEEPLFPPDAQVMEGPQAPLVFLVRRDPMTARGWFAIRALEELYEPEGLCQLAPSTALVPVDVPEGLAAFVAEHGATVLNVPFSGPSPGCWPKRSPRPLASKLPLWGWVMWGARCSPGSSS